MFKKLYISTLKNQDQNFDVSFSVILGTVHCTQDLPVEDEAAETTPAATAAAAAAEEEAEVPPKMAAEAAAAAPRSIPAGAPTDAAAAAAGSKPPTPVLLDEAWPAELSCNVKKI